MAIFALRRAALPISFLGVGLRLAIGCGSDSGSEHGGDIPTLPELDGGRRLLPDGGVLEPDGAVVPPGDDDDDPGDASTCESGTAAIIAGTSSTLTGSVKVKGSAWLTSTIANGAAKSKPSLVALGGAFIGATQGADDSLLALKYTTTWATPEPIGVGTDRGSPTLAVTGSTAHIVYSGGPNTNTDYRHGVYDGTAWNGISELVGTAGPPEEHSFGTISAALAGEDDGSLVFAENGGDNGLYARTWAQGAGWIKAIPIQGAGSVGQQGATPEAVAVQGATIIIYADNNTAGANGAPIAWASHVNGSATWGTPNQPPHEIAGAATTEKMAAIALSPTTILLSFREAGTANYTIGTVTGTTDADINVTWSPVAPISGAPITVDSVAAVAKGICGADAIFAFAVAGKVEVTQLTIATNKWTIPSIVKSAAGSNIAIATML